MWCVFRRNQPGHHDHGRYFFLVDHRFGGSDKFRSTDVLQSAPAFHFRWLPTKGWECGMFFDHLYSDEWRDLVNDPNWEAVPVNLSLVC